MEAGLLIFASLCFIGLAWLMWDGRERRKPMPRPRVPMDQRMPPL